MKKQLLNKSASFLVATALVVATAGFSFVSVANAGSLSALSDTMSREKVGVASTHLIKFTVAGAVNTSGQKIIVTFPSDFNFSSIAITEVTMKDGPTTGLENTETLAASPGSSIWGAVFSGTSNRVLTLTAPTSGTYNITAGKIVTLAYASTHSINGSLSSSAYTVGITTTASDGVTTLDTGNLAIPLIGNDQVVVTATVTPTITFTLTQVAGGLAGTASNAVDFGALTSGAPRYATNGASSGGSPTASTVALDANIATNAATGYTISYSAPSSLTDGLHPITPFSIATNAGAFGTSQFAMSAAVATGSPTGGNAPYSAYAYVPGAGASNWSFQTPTVTALTTSTSPTAVDTYNLRYIANIPPTQAAGNYNLTITYIATGNF